MRYLSVVNWGKFQHYSDRNPPWIKLYHTLLDDYEYGCLQDDSKLLLTTLYLLASRTENEIPADPEWVARRGNLHHTPDFKPLIDAGFLEYTGDAADDSDTIAERKQSDRPEAEPETEPETEEESARDLSAEEYANAPPSRRDRWEAVAESPTCWTTAFDNKDRDYLERVVALHAEVWDVREASLRVDLVGKIAERSVRYRDSDGPTAVMDIIRKSKRLYDAGHDDYEKCSSLSHLLGPNMFEKIRQAKEDSNETVYT